MLRQALKKRPLLSAGSAGVGGIIATAGLVECHAEWQERESTKDPTSAALHLPRTYDRNVISAYWMRRPISITYRLGQVMYELAPLGMDYVRDFVILNQDNNGLRDKEDLQRQHAIRLRHALTNLGPAFVKGGQQLSIRPDLVPPVVLKELQQLCDAVKPIDDDIALQMIRDELGIDDLQQVFEAIQLVASASIGQVYKAKINVKDGTRVTKTEVAIKVQRPGIRRCFSLDLFLLQKYGDCVDLFTSVFTNQAPFHKALFDHFSRGSYSELDYEQEADNQRRFQSELAKRDCAVVVPNVYDQYTTERILTTQWIEGVKLADSSKERIRELIPVGVELFLTQLLDIGAFHADPHPGNLLVTKDEGKLCLLDFGLCAEVDSKSRDAMTKAIVHLLARDFDSLVAHDAKELGFLPQDFDTTELKPILTKVLTGGLLESGSNMRMRKRKLMEISNELNEIFFRYPFQVPPFFALVTRGLGLLEGIALTGDPNFDIFRASAPYATKRAVALLRQRMSTRRVKTQ